MAVAVPVSLVEEIWKRRCVLFVGAGLSAAAKLPDWKALLRAMVARLEDEDLAREIIPELRKMIDDGKLLAVADECRVRLGERLYLDLLKAQVTGDSTPLTDLHRLITELPFTAVVTTNYDKLLERAYTQYTGVSPTMVTSSTRTELGTLLFDGRFFILKAHGHIDDAASLILTAGDYQGIIHANPAFLTMFSALLMTHSVLFIGYSLADPDFTLMLERQLSTFGPNIPDRWAVMSGVGAVEEAVIKRSANIRVLSYRDGQHGDVKVFLQTLVDRIAAKTVEEKTRTSVVTPGPALWPPGDPRSRPAPSISPDVAPAAPRYAPAETTAASLVPRELGGVELTLKARHDGLDCVLRSEGGEAPFSTDVRWSSLYGEIASLLGQREPESRPQTYRAIGRSLARLLPADAIAAIDRNQPITLRITSDIVDVPWELATCDKDTALAIARPVVRHTMVDGTLERGLPSVRQPMRVLLIGDPGEHPQFRLEGALEEVRQIEALYEADGSVKVLMLTQGAAGVNDVVRVLSTIPFDIVHFAGHAWFDRQQSYLAFDEDEMLTASELRSLLAAQPPAILILNSHYTAFYPRGMRPAELSEDDDGTAAPPTSYIGFTASASAAGVGAYIGCFESPDDNTARHFGVGVHGELLKGARLIDALHRARVATHIAAPRDVTALQYVLSGHGGYRIRG